MLLSFCHSAHFSPPPIHLAAPLHPLSAFLPPLAGCRRWQKHSLRHLPTVRRCWFGNNSLLFKNSSDVMRQGNLESLRPAVAARAGFQELFHNHVLVTAVAATVMGQLLKPLTSAVLGKGLNWKLAIKSGGLPSVHSAVVTAVCTVLAVERGLSDSVFGLSLVCAGIVMYDSQGVRRAVGKQAEVINTIVLPSARENTSSFDKFTSLTNSFSSIVDEELASDSSKTELSSSLGIDSSTVRLRTTASTMTFEDLENRSSSLSTIRPSDNLKDSAVGLPGSGNGTGGKNGGACTRSDDFFKESKNLPGAKSGLVSLQEIGNLNSWRHIPLKESVGHTKVEVVVGGVLGIFVALALSNVVDSLT
eukprot:c13735_g1_i1 orf=229-1311(+)